MLLRKDVERSRWEESYVFKIPPNVDYQEDKLISNKRDNEE